MLEIPMSVDESVQMEPLGKGFVRVITRVETYENRKIKLSKLRKAVETTENDDGTFDITLETNIGCYWVDNNVTTEEKDTMIAATVDDVADQLRDIGF